MSVLIVATNLTDPGLAEKVREGLHQRVDYLELAALTQGRYVDYDVVRSYHGRLKRFEDWLRFDLRQAFVVARLVRASAYRVVISLSERVGIPLAFLLPRSVRHVVIQHHPMSRLKLWLEKLTGVHRRWERIITISQAEKAAMQKALRLKDGHAVALHCPVDTHFFSPAQGDPYTERQKIESLGLSHRDYPTLIRAMRLLPEIPCSFRVGSAWVSRDAGFTAQDLPPNVDLQPFVSPAVLREKILENRFLVVTTRGYTQWSAGCTTVQIAQAMGKAVVATDMPGLREYVEDGKTALLVKPGDPQALAEAIRYLWEHPEVARQMGARGRELMCSKLSLDSWLERLVNLIKAPEG